MAEDYQNALEDLLNAIEEQEISDLGIKDGEPEVLTREQANFYARKYLELKRRTDSNIQVSKDYLDKEKQRVQAWLEATNRPLEQSLAYLGGILRAFAENELKGSTRRSLKMVDATLSFKKQQPEYTYDEDKLREALSAVENGAKYLRDVPQAIEKVELKKVLEINKDGTCKLNGKVLAGVTAIEREDKFSIG